MYVKGAQELIAQSPEELMDILTRGMSSRKTSSTGMSPPWVNGLHERRIPSLLFLTSAGFVVCVEQR